jgi:hypothetical protein
MKIPKHKGSFSLTHNQHLGYYMTVGESIAGHDHGYREDDWVSEEQKRKALETNECWTMQVYTDTPVGFYLHSAADLDVLLAHAATQHETYEVEV